MSYLFSRALVEEYSPENCSDGAPSALLSVMPTPAKFWHNGKTMDSSDLSRFGLTCQVLTVGHGEALLMSYQAAFPARTLAAATKMQPASAASVPAYGEKWRELSMRYDRASSSWKTAHCLLSEDLPWSSVTLPKWGMTRSGAVYQHPTSARPMKGIGSGSWPTPSVTTTGGPTGLGGGTGNKRRLQRMGMGLMATGRLNPRWTEWLMGWPLNWTKLTPASSAVLAMGKFREWQHEHSAFCPQASNDAEMPAGQQDLNIESMRAAVKNIRIGEKEIAALKERLDAAEKRFEEP